MSDHAKFCVNQVTCCHSGEFKDFAQFSVLDPCHNAPENFRDLSHKFGELFNIIGELLTNCVLAILKDLVNFGEFFCHFASFRLTGF